MAAVLHHALVIDIILVLVLVLAVRKENSAFGHAQIALSNSRAAGRRGSPADFFKVRDLTRAADFFHSPFQT